MVEAQLATVSWSALVYTATSRRNDSALTPGGTPIIAVVDGEWYPKVSPRIRYTMYAIKMAVGRSVL